MLAIDFCRKTCIERLAISTYIFVIQCVNVRESHAVLVVEMLVHLGVIFGEKLLDNANFGRTVHLAQLVDEVADFGIFLVEIIGVRVVQKLDYQRNTLNAELKLRFRHKAVVDVRNSGEQVGVDVVLGAKFGHGFVLQNVVNFKIFKHIQQRRVVVDHIGKFAFRLQVLATFVIHNSLFFSD